MQLFFLSLIAIALVYGLIRFLHARQVQRTRDIADQGMPLPPLDDTTPAQSIPTEGALTVSPPVTAQAGAQSWRDEVKALRDAGRFQEALSLCSRQYPRMLAFRQTLITLRSQLKSGDEAPEEALTEIYRTAILAGLAKAGHQPPGADDATTGELPRIDDPRGYWNELGYRKLDLLTKTDCSLLIRYWGEPQSHIDINRFLQNRKP